MQSGHSGPVAVPPLCDGGGVNAVWFFQKGAITTGK